VTPEAWEACTDPYLMLEFLRAGGAARDRRLRLFACACVRQVWHLLTDERSRTAAVLAEQYADGAVSIDRLSPAYAASAAAAGLSAVTTHFAAARAAADAVRSYSPELRYALVRAVGAAAGAAASAAGGTQGQADLLRDIFGDRFKRTPFDPSWRSEMAVSLARQMYETRDFLLMPILGDALADAGCPDGDVLEHCRGPGPHSRGCWVADLVLGKS
jgi:hypothetical protein